MKKYVLAIAIASGALFGLSAQAAPLATGPAGLQNQVTSDAVKVFHCRNWSGGWGCGGGGWGHNRWGSHRRWGSGGWGGGWGGHRRWWSHRRWGSGGYWR